MQAGTKLAVPVRAQITRPMTAQAAYSNAHLSVFKGPSPQMYSLAHDLSLLVFPGELERLDFGTITGWK